VGAIHDDLFETRERTAADEQNVGGIDLQEFLLRMLAPALRRHRGDRAFDQLQKRLLHALARHVPRDRRVVGFARNLVDFIDVDDAGLRLFDIVVAFLQELLNDVLDVLADIARFGQGRRIGNRERNVQQARQRLRQQRFAGPRGSNEKDIALREFDFVARTHAFGAARLQALVMVVDRDREDPLGALLADDILVQYLFDFLRLRQLVAGTLGAFLELFADDVVA